MYNVSNNIVKYNLIKQLQKQFLSYNEIKVWYKIEKAFNLACELHKNQYRKSGEPYIMHPIQVARIVMGWNADVDTVCAALLHDVVEDTPFTISQIKEQFNETVGILDDGVTKLSHKEFYNKSKKEVNDINLKKLFDGLMLDLRIIIIKLADRLHNMRTIKYMSREKQLEIADETLMIFVPLAKQLGMYSVKRELEDLCLYTFNHNLCKVLSLYIYNAIKNNYDNLETIKEILQMHLNIPCKIMQRDKNIYQVCRNYEKVSGQKIDDLKINEDDVYKTVLGDFNKIQHIRSLKLLTKNEEDCENLFDRTIKILKPQLYTIKDYINTPMLNGYSAKMFYSEEIDLLIKFATEQMHLRGELGCASFWKENKENALSYMIDEFAGTSCYEEINNLINSGNTEEYVTSVTHIILQERVKKYSNN